MAQSAAMDAPAERMPNPVRIFLAYAFLLLAGIGISLRYVVDEAINAPISPLGVVWMALLAYTIFTITLVLQHKEVGRSFALGLATLTLPAVPLLLMNQLFPAAIAVALVGVAVFGALTRPSVRDYLREP
jgi:hypothetical protein